jgi:hypothetical protein
MSEPTAAAGGPRTRRVVEVLAALEREQRAYLEALARQTALAEAGNAVLEMRLLALEKGG